MPGPSFRDRKGHDTGYKYPTGRTKPSGKAKTTTQPSKAYKPPRNVTVTSVKGRSGSRRSVPLAKSSKAAKQIRKQRRRIEDRQQQRTFKALKQGRGLKKVSRKGTKEIRSHGYEPPSRKTDSWAENLLEGGLVGLVDKDVAREGRKYAWGSANPSAVEVGVGAIPGVGKVAGRAAKAIRAVGVGKKATKTYKAATKAPKKVPPKAKPKPKKIEDDLSRAGRKKMEGKPSKVRTKVKKVSAEKRAEYSKAGRYNKRRRRAQAIAAGGVPLGASVYTVGGEIAKRSAEATAEKPGKTLATTARVAMGIPGGVVGIGADTAASAKRLALGEKNALGPLKGQAKAQTDYWKAVSRIATGSDEQAKKIVQGDVGLVPVISGGLTAAGFAKAGARVGKAGRRPRNYDPPTTKPRNKRAMKKTREGEVPREPARGAKRGRKRESERAAVTVEKVTGQSGRESKMKVRNRAGRRKHYETEVGKLDRKKVHGEVSVADTLQFLGREGFQAIDDPKRLRAEARRARERLEPGKRQPGRRDDTETILRAIEENPEAVIKNRKAVREVLAHRAQMYHERDVEANEEVVGLDRAEGRPDPQREARKYQAVAEREGVLQRHERIPHELRNTAFDRPKKGHDATRKIRHQAKGFKRKAKVLRQRAIEARKAGKKERAEELKAEADFREAEALAALTVVDRFKRAAKLEIQAFSAERAGDGVKANRLRNEALSLREKGHELQEALRTEFVGEAQAAQKGLAEPQYFREMPARTRAGLSVSKDFPGGMAAAKEKFRSGALAKRGEVREGGRSMLEQDMRIRTEMEDRAARREFAEENFLDIDGRFKTEEEWNALTAEGKVPAGHELVTAQEFSAAFQRGDIDLPGFKGEVQRKKWELDSETPAKPEELKGLVPTPPGKKLYAAVPTSRITEFRKQQKQIAGFARGVRVASRVQSGLMLATSPAWFAFQLVATPMAMLVRHPNPAAWIRTGTKMAQAWRKIPKRDRVNFDAHMGATSADFLTIGDPAKVLRPDTMGNFKSALDTAYATPTGRMVRALGRGIKKGGPLIAANRRYEAALRRFEGLLELDRLSGLNRKGKPRASARLVQFGEKVARVNDTIYRHMEKMRGLPFDKQVSFYDRNPRYARELENEVNDTVGAWGSLTNTEKYAAAATVFYPFMRFSLKWAFSTMPRKHPIRTAVLLNIGQANAEELQSLLGGSPSFFQGYGTLVQHRGEGGEPVTGLDLARAMPGGNAILEAVGNLGTTGDKGSLLGTASRPLQPLIGGTLLALAGQDAFGRPSELPPHRLLAQLATSLNPATRQFRDEVSGEPQSEISKLFQEISDKSGGVLDYTMPRLVHDLRRDRQAVRLATLLNITSKKPEASEAYEPGADVPTLRRRELRADIAQEEINRLMRHYEIQTKAEQEAVSERGGKKLAKVKYAK